MNKPSTVEITELEKIEAERVDGVANPANGFPILMLKSLPDKDPDTADAAKDAIKSAAAELLAAVTALVPGVDLSAPITKADGDEAANIGDAQSAIAMIARLIVREAESLAAGNLGEACDISDLLCAVDALRWFINDERYEAAEDAVVTIAMSAPTDTTKTTGADLAPALDETRINEIIKAALAEATKSHEAQLAAVRDELAKVKATPIPGGPVLTRTADDAAKAAQRDHHAHKAAYYRTLAEQVSDQRTAAGYRELAAKADAGQG